MTRNLKTFYLASAILGVVVPYYCFWRLLRSEGIGVMPLIEGAVINGAAAGFTLDVVISSIVFWAFMLSQEERVLHPSGSLCSICLWACRVPCRLICGQPRVDLRKDS